MSHITQKELLERLFHEDYERLKNKKLRITRLRIPGKEVCLAHVIGVSHEGEDHRGESIGLIRFTPWEAVVVAADVAMKSADVEIGFMDRFCGSLILTGRLSEVQTAVEEVVRFFREELHFHTCEIHRS